jgi:hypothetical protein
MEQRHGKRWPARLRSARLFDSSGRLLVECRVLDLSSTGARLQPQSDRPLPLELLYRAGSDEGFRAAELVWIRHREIGIRFSDTPQEEQLPAVGSERRQLRNESPSA